MRVRRTEAELLRARGVDPYPATAPRSHTLAEVRSQFAHLAPDTETGTPVSVVGRVLLKRDAGGLGLATLRDGSGDLQVIVDARHLHPDALFLWEHDIGPGDHVSVTGEVVTTHRPEPSVRATAVLLAGKALRPLPDDHEGPAEVWVPGRYVDLIVRPEARTAAYQRATVVRSVRDSLHARGFTEAEPPVLRTIHRGAHARPCETHLEQLVVGGIEKVFGLGRPFRDPGAELGHEPEATTLAAYEAYGDHDTMRVLAQAVVQEAAAAVHGAPVARRRDASGRVVELDLSGQWPVQTVCQAVSGRLGEEITADTPLHELVRHAYRVGLELDLEPARGVVLHEIYVELCERQTTTPVFYTDFPTVTAPLTRAHRRDPRLAEKWGLVMFGAEQGTAHSALVDPVDMRERLAQLRPAAGDGSAMRVDEDLVEALEYGMPPTGGLGLGIDRLVLNLTAAPW